MALPPYLTTMVRPENVLSQGSASTRAAALGSAT